MTSYYSERWFVDLYEQEETQTDDVKLILALIGDKRKLDILEPCCGSGRILVPLAKEGHRVTGFDLSALMLQKLTQKADCLTNVSVAEADAIKDAWGEGFDLVVLAGNILLNIETSGDYASAQIQMIRKAAGALKQGGHLYLDNSGFLHPEQAFSSGEERVIFEGTDSAGTVGRFLLFDQSYDITTQITKSKRRLELTTAAGEHSVEEMDVFKHVPSISQMRQWLTDAGFIIEQNFGDYSGNPIRETTTRAIYWARRAD